MARVRTRTNQVRAKPVRTSYVRSHDHDRNARRPPRPPTPAAAACLYRPCPAARYPTGGRRMPTCDEWMNGFGRKPAHAVPIWQAPASTRGGNQPANEKRAVEGGTIRHSSSPSRSFVYGLALVGRDRVGAR